MAEHMMDDATPNFICPACGHFCATTWGDVDLWDEFPGLAYMSGQVLIDVRRHNPLMTLCLHPDGSGSYGGAEAGVPKATSRTVLLTPDEAAELLEASEPYVPEGVHIKEVEDAVWRVMAGLIAENAFFSVEPQTRPEDFLWLYDRLAALPASSPQADIYAAGDPTLRRLQDLVMELLGGDGRLEELLADALAAEEQTVFTPQDLQALLDTPYMRGDG